MTISTFWSVIVSIAAGIATIAGAWKIVKPTILKPVTEINDKLTKLAADSTRSDEEIKGQLACIDEQVSTVQREKMMWAYTYYGLKHHPISLETKMSLEAMYDQYTNQGKHNHIPQDFKQRINTAPIEQSK